MDFFFELGPKVAQVYYYENKTNTVANTSKETHV